MATTEINVATINHFYRKKNKLSFTSVQCNIYSLNAVVAAVTGAGAGAVSLCLFIRFHFILILLSLHRCVLRNYRLCIVWP